MYLYSLSVWINLSIFKCLCNSIVTVIKNIIIEDVGWCGKKYFKSIYYEWRMYEWRMKDVSNDIYIKEWKNLTSRYKILFVIVIHPLYN